MAREPAQETRTLRACIRDLVALSALPACWVGRPTEDVVDDVRELLAQLLELEVMRIDLRDPETHKGLAPKGRAGAAGSRAPEAGEAVGLHFATFALGLDGELGGITVGARRPGFPGGKARGEDLGR